VVEALGPGRAAPDAVTAPPAEAERAVAGTAAAVGERFRGDAVAAHPREARRAVVGGLDALADAGVLGARPKPAADPSDPVALAVRTRDGGREIPVEVVLKRPEAMGAVNGEVPVARFTHDPATGKYVVEVSTGAHPREVERALAHEIGEIRARESGSTATADALAPGARSKELSPHDHGRLSELDVLARHLDTALATGDTANAARLQDDAERLADHLGLVGDTQAARDRAKLALAALPEGSRAKALLEAALIFAPGNPFLQGRTGGLADLDIVGAQYERARAMEDPALMAAAVERARLLLLTNDLVVRGKGGSGPGIERHKIDAEVGRLGANARELLDAAVDAVRKSPTLTDADRRILGTLRRPDPGHEAVYAADLTPVPAAKPTGPEVTAIEQRRKQLIDSRPTATEAELKTLGRQINQESEALGMLAGRRVAEEHLRIPAGAEVPLPARGAGLPDLLYIVDGRVIVIECKGGASGLGVRKGPDGTSLVQQGTKEYLQSLFTEMSNRQSLTAEQRQLAKDIAIELAKDHPNVEYHHVTQPIDPSTGRIGTPQVGKFEIGGP
jgi:hypothetical protein